MDMKAVDPGDMLRAIALREREDARLGDILLTRGWVSEADLFATLSLQWRAKAVDLVADPPDPRLLDRVGAEFCLSHAVLPWRGVGEATVLATARPEDFGAAKAQLPDDFGPVIMALAPERDIHAAILATRQTALIRKAESRVAGCESCRGQGGNRAGTVASVTLGLLLAGLVVLPAATIGALAIWAILTLVATTGLKLAAWLAEMRAPRTAPATHSARGPARLPVVSVMVPLFREDDIAPRLIRRIGRIDYPKELLDILLVVEEDDHATHAALSHRRLPRWMRIVTVPSGPVRTKPRALNYALDFCRGSIIGVWDAEDAPEAAQIHKVVRRFHDAPADVACLQGILDFYNARHNWLSRCFAIEYAVWFRAVLPGLARLGFVVPLGGTTLFFRREVIRELGGWDAHNVTEDADLGLRLARRGYRTELIDTVTEEEPNARVLAWIRQRSRWQKGFAMTWVSHMRDPARLWRELGAKRFIGVQILFVGSLSQAVLAPLLWSFWLIALGLPHPLTSLVPPLVILALGALFVACEAVNIAAGLWATRGQGHRHLMKWVPTLHAYFPLAALSSYKALHEWVCQPFYWDKTSHGVIEGHLAEPPQDRLPVYVLTDPVPAAVKPVGSPAMLRLVVNRARRAYVLGSTIANAARRPGIEFQPCFEGFGDM
ncbi:MAG: glycosyltransferase [Paracoccaceae bacterium]